MLETKESFESRCQKTTGFSLSQVRVVRDLDRLLDGPLVCHRGSSYLIHIGANKAEWEGETYVPVPRDYLLVEVSR